MHSLPDRSANPDESLVTELENVPQLSERVLLDLVNGLEVSGEQLRFREQQSLVDCFVGWLDGSSRRRDQLIDEQHQRSIETLSASVIALMRFGRITAEGLAKVSDALAKTRAHVCKLTKLAADTQQQLERLELKLDGQTRELRERVSEIKTENDARHAVSATMEAWEAGRIYVGYPPAIQAFLALDDLARGANGQVLMGDEHYRQHLLDRAVNVMRRVMGRHSVSDDLRQPVEKWLTTTPNGRLEGARQMVVSYLLSAPREAAPLHALTAVIAEAGYGGALPDWLDGAHRNGFPRLYDAVELVETFSDELQMLQRPKHAYGRN